MTTFNGFVRRERGHDEQVSKLLDFLFPDDATHDEISRTCRQLDRAGITPDAVMQFDAIRQEQT
jgi:hypothetical protein